MTRPLNIRRALLSAVDNFLEASPESLARAHRLVKRCYAARRFITLDEIVWGGIIMQLTDSVYYEDRAILDELRVLLSTGSPEIHRAYLNFDFTSDFTSVERAWYEQLTGMLDFLNGFPFTDVDAAIGDYEMRVAEIAQTMQQEPPPAQLDDEMIYHRILRDVSEVLAHLDMRLSLLRLGRLAPKSPYSYFPPPSDDNRIQAPDASGSVDWVRRALRSIAAQDCLLITWQVTPEHYQLSLH